MVFPCLKDPWLTFLFSLVPVHSLCVREPCPASVRSCVLPSPVDCTEILVGRSVQPEKVPLQLGEGLSLMSAPCSATWPSLGACGSCLSGIQGSFLRVMVARPMWLMLAGVARSAHWDVQAGRGWGGHGDQGLACLCAWWVGRLGRVARGPGRLILAPSGKCATVFLWFLH